MGVARMRGEHKVKDERGRDKEVVFGVRDEKKVVDSAGGGREGSHMWIGLKRVEKQCNELNQSHANGTN